jgi:hypothetical protein
VSNTTSSKDFPTTTVTGPSCFSGTGSDFKCGLRVPIRISTSNYLISYEVKSDGFVGHSNFCILAGIIALRVGRCSAVTPINSASLS